MREQFEIAHPTEPYKRLLEHLPGEFVGTGARLRSIVEAVSLAMAEAFRAQDMALPPWRRTSAALSKWNLVLHHHPLDVPVSPPKHHPQWWPQSQHDVVLEVLTRSCLTSWKEFFVLSFCSVFVSIFNCNDVLQDDQANSKQGNGVITGQKAKQPLKEHLLNDFNIPKTASIDIFAKASIEPQRFLGGSPRPALTIPGLENTTEVAKPKISLLAR